MLINLSVRVTSRVVSLSTLDHLRVKSRVTECVAGIRFQAGALSFLLVFASVTARGPTQFPLKQISKVSFAWGKRGWGSRSSLLSFRHLKMLLHNAVTVNGFVLRDAFLAQPVILHYQVPVTRQK